MLTYMAKRMSSFFIYLNVIKEDDRVIYDYSFEILLSTVINLMAIVILALVSDTVILTIWFLLGFITLRTTAGGFHAETHIGCFFTLICVYIAFLNLVLILTIDVQVIATVVNDVISLLLVIIFSPVEDCNKPFTNEEYKKFKVVSNITIVVMSAVSTVLVFCFEREKWGFSFSLGMLVVSIFLIAGTLKNKFRERINNKNKGVE